MTDRRQITDLEELKGKTIERAIMHDDRPLLIVFADGSFLCATACGGYSSDIAYIEVNNEPEYKDRLAAGLASQAEIAQETKRLQAMQAAGDEWRRNARRAEYEKLKAEFDGKPEATP